LFRSGAIHTHFIEEHLKDPDATPALPADAVAAVIAALQGATASTRDAAQDTSDPWRDLGAWRLA
jgi:hypothetical protein